MVLASGDPRDAGALPIATDARVMGVHLEAGQKVDLALAEGHRAYLVAPQGRYTLNEIQVEAGDGVAVQEEPVLVLRAETALQLLLAEVW